MAPHAQKKPLENASLAQSGDRTAGTGARGMTDLDDRALAVVKFVWAWIRETRKRTAGAAVIAALLIGGLGWLVVKAVHDDGSGGAIPDADTPPAEFLYLDTARALAYLGQLEGGLSDQEKRTLATTRSNTANLSAGSAASIAAATESKEGVEQTVAPTAADRVYRLIRHLRADDSHTSSASVGHQGPWLNDVNLELGANNTLERVRHTLKGAEEGTFIRLANARLCLPIYAAILPRVRQAATCETGDLLPQLRLSKRERHAIGAFRRHLGRDARLPFVARLSHSQRRLAGGRIDFFLPTTYNGLAREPSFLSGRVTILGKVVRNGLLQLGDRVEGHHVDRETVSRYTAALKRLPLTIGERLGLPAEHLSRIVKSSVTFDPTSVMVVVPIAIYQ